MADGGETVTSGNRSKEPGKVARGFDGTSAPTEETDHIITKEKKAI